MVAPGVVPRRNLLLGMPKTQPPKGCRVPCPGVLPRRPLGGCFLAGLMDWINLHTSFLDSPEFIGAEPVDRATWVCLLRYCVGQENGGRIVSCKAWGDRKWQQLIRVTLEEVRRTADLWAWDGDDLVVTNYPAEKEQEVQEMRALGRTKSPAKAAAARANGAKGGRPADNPNNPNNPNNPTNNPTPWVSETQQETQQETQRKTEPKTHEKPIEGERKGKEGEGEGELSRTRAPRREQAPDEHDLGAPPSPTPPPPRTNADRWRYEIQGTAWAQALVKSVKIGSENWPKWESLLSDYFAGDVSELVKFARTLTVERWPETIENEWRKRRPDAVAASNGRKPVIL